MLEKYINDLLVSMYTGRASKFSDEFPEECNSIVKDFEEISKTMVNQYANGYETIAIDVILMRLGIKYFGSKFKFKMDNDKFYVLVGKIREELIEQSTNTIIPEILNGESDS